MLKKLWIGVLISSVVLSNFILAYTDSATNKAPFDYRDTHVEDIKGKVVTKPKSNFQVEVFQNGVVRDNIKPDTGEDLDQKPNELVAYVGETLKFKDLSKANQAGTYIDQYDLQYYGAGLFYNTVIKGTSNFEQHEVKLIEPGALSIYLCVRNSAQVPKGMCDAWSDNGTHQTVGYGYTPKGMYWYFTEVKINVLSQPVSPTPTSTPTPTPTSTPTPTPTPIATPVSTPRPTPVVSIPPSPKGVIKFNPSSCTWRNTDLAVKVYVDGDTTTKTLGSDIRPYTWSSWVYPTAVPGEPTPAPRQQSHTQSTYWGFTEAWNIDKIKVSGALLTAAKTIPNNTTVTVTKEGHSDLDAALTGWNADAKTKTWVSGLPPVGSWAAAAPSIQSETPNQNYASHSGEYKIDKTDPVVSFTYGDRDHVNGSINEYWYEPNNNLTVITRDALSGIGEVRYQWSKTNTFPSINTMTNLNVSTLEYSNQTVKSDLKIHQGQKRIGVWYVHVYAKDHAGNTVQSTVTVDIKCKLYDFRVTDIKDPNWKTFFRNTNGDLKGRVMKVNELPVTERPDLRNTFVKKGYAVYFKFNSKGLNEKVDRVEIKPRFFFIENPAVQSNVEVDLYYHLNQQYFIQVGSQRDKVQIDYNKSSIGSLSLLNAIPHIVQDTKTGEWSGDYYIPSNSIPVLKGSTRPDLEANQYKKGYILVTFQLKAYKDNNLVFTYITNQTGQWQTEGGPKSSAFYPGDVVLFNNTYSALSDYKVNVDRGN